MHGLHARAGMRWYRAVLRGGGGLWPVRRGIRDGVANCADYLDRIVRQLEGMPSRHYVAEKAQALLGSRFETSGTPGRPWRWRAGRTFST
jgi:hypothetical protein